MGGENDRRAYAKKWSMTTTTSAKITTARSTSLGPIFGPFVGAS